MNDQNSIVAKRHDDGTLVQVLPGGGTRPLGDETGWSHVQAMMDEHVHAAALADPVAQPLTPERAARMQRVPRAKTLRRTLGLTQEEFAARYQIPLGTVRDGERGRAEPDQPARAYLEAIAGNPEAVQRALRATPETVR